MNAEDKTSKPPEDADLPVIEAEPVTSGAADAPAQDGTGRGRGAARLLPWLLVLLLAAALAGAGWLGWQQLRGLQRQAQAQQERLAALQAQLDRTRRQQDERLQALQQAIDGLRQGDRKRLEDLEQRVETLQQALEAERERSGRTPRDWVTAEVAYLIRIASQRLRLMRDYEGAIAALRAADGRLRDLADPALLPVRERLADDIQRLKHAERPDLVGIALRLDRMVASLRPLPLRIPARERGTSGAEADAHAAADEAAPAADGQVAGKGWKHLLADAWARLRARVTVRHYDETVQNLPDRERELLLAQLLRLRLEAARVDVLRQDDDDYHRQLEAALKLIDTYYQDAEGHPLRSEIEALDRIRLRPPLPDVSGALDLLRQIESRRRLQAGEKGA